MKVKHGQLISILQGTPESFFLQLAGQFGLECENCGHCCRDSERIALNSSDLPKLNTIDNKKFVTTDKDGFCIKQDKGCPYHQDSGCKIYKNRPYVCRLYPFLSIDKKVPGFHLYKDCPATVKLVEKVIAMHELIQKDPSQVLTFEDVEFSKVVLLANYARDYNSRKLRLLLEKSNLYKYTEILDKEKLRDLCIRYMELDMDMLMGKEKNPEKEKNETDNNTLQL
jgi:Fe-S-cluster containining protein